MRYLGAGVGHRTKPYNKEPEEDDEMDVDEDPSWAQQYWGDEEEDESEDEFGDAEVDEEGSGRDEDEDEDEDFGPEDGKNSNELEDAYGDF